MTSPLSSSRAPTFSDSALTRPIGNAIFVVSLSSQQDLIHWVPRYANGEKQVKAKSATKSGRNNHLEEALALLIQNQASLLSHQASFQMAEMNRLNSERFARIEEELANIRTILLRHEQILQGLPETIREKIGFKSPA